MTRPIRMLLLAPFAAAVLAAAPGQVSTYRGYAVTAVPQTAVKLEGGFWGGRQATVVSVTIPHLMKECERTGRIKNFESAAAVLKGATGLKFATAYAFDDSDVYKVIEAAAYALMIKPDPELERKLDVWIEKIAAAQEPDGYLYTARTIDPRKPPRMSGPQRWVNLADSHELYNLGHLYEAAVAYTQATGKKNLLAVAEKSVALLRKTFGPEPGQIKLVPGHEEIELALVKLWRLTGNDGYMSLAMFFLDERGNAAGHKLYGEYAQDHKPVLEQDEAVGHAVRAAYLYSGMADVAAWTGLPKYMAPLNKIWTDVVTKKLYLTGGIGAAGNIEGFGPAYDLPNPSGYAETCATIALALWNWRMALSHSDGKYMDLFERAAYNAFLSGAGLSGDLFFYPNPLASFGQHERTPWFTCACCPPNVGRFIASLGGFVYGTAGGRVFVNLYAPGKARIETSAGPVALEQTTDYPWSGEIALRVAPERNSRWTLLLRIPGWAQNRPLPGDLYSYPEPPAGHPAIKVNGEAVAVTIDKGYAAITRDWRAAGDKVEIHLPMPVRRVRANALVKADIGRVAVERGPLVYCAEAADNGGRVSQLVLDDAAPLAAEPWTGALGRMMVIKGQATGYRLEDGRRVGAPQPLTLIPYYAWAHRGRGEMEVWMAREPSKARPISPPGLAAAAAVTASEGAQRLRGINDGYDPERSDDAVGYMHWWPKKGQLHWVQYEFKDPVTVSETAVFWFDDTGSGECRLPASWRLLYKAGDQWTPVKTAAAAPVTKDAYDTLRFEPVKASAFRLEVQAQSGWATGIQEWKLK